MAIEKIQTLHPIPNKVNKSISVDKYHFIKDHLIAVLLDHKFLTHTALMELLYERVNDNFDGGVQWYGEVVKLDLEARSIIFRSKDKPEVYSINDLIQD